MGNTQLFGHALLEKKGLIGVLYMKHRFFTQLQRTFYAKKGSIMTRK